MPDAAIAHALTARLRQHPLVADCTVVTRNNEDVPYQVAFVAPRREVPASERWPEAELLALETGHPCRVVVVDRLPLLADGRIDEQGLLTRQGHDDAALPRLEALLHKLPGVRHAAVLKMASA